MPFKILYVEQNATYRQLVRDMLALTAYQVMVAMDGPSSFEAALEQEPDLILIGINLLSDVAIIADLKQSPSLHHIPIIAVTADASDEMIRQCFDAGCESTLHKPINRSALLDSIHRFTDGEVPKPVEDQMVLSDMPSERKKVLIVEDNPDLRFIFARTFDQRHFSVHIAVDGVEAIDSLQKELPDIVILDVNMPRLSGFDVLRYVRNNQRTKNIKVVMVTGNTMALQSPEADEADLLLIKPINIADLITLAQRLLPKEVL